MPANPNPARVVNLSLGGPGSCPSTLQSAIDDARGAGAVVVAAAGNTATGTAAGSFFPASRAGVLTVAATSVIGDRAVYSNYGSVVDLAAPGGDASFGPGSTILSTFNAGTTTPDLSEDGWTYDWQQGTSMAAPHVAGVIALTLAANPALTPTQVRNVVRGSARPFPSGPGYDPAYVCTSNPSHPTRKFCGRGIADAGRAVTAATSTPAAPPAPNRPTISPARDSVSPRCAVRYSVRMMTTKPPALETSSADQMMRSVNNACRWFGGGPAGGLYPGIISWLPLQFNRCGLVLNIAGAGPYARCLRLAAFSRSIP